MKASLFKALVVLGAAFLMPVAANAQTAGPASFSTNVRGGGPISGTGTTWSWNVPAGQYVATARISYALQSTRTDSGGGASQIRCKLQQAGVSGFLDIASAHIGAGPTFAMSSSGELTLTSRVSMISPGVLSIVCDPFSANARSSQRIDSMRIELIQVASFNNLTTAP